MDNTSSAAGGLAQGLNQAIQQYLGVNIDQMRQQAQSQQQLANDKEKINYTQEAEYQKQSRLQTDELNRQTGLAKYKQSLEGEITPELAEKALPGAGAAMVTSFQKQNNRLPTVDEAHKFLETAKQTLSKQGSSDEVRLSQLGRQLSSDREFTQIRTKRDSLENVGKLIEQVKTQPDGPDRRQQYEIAMGQVKALIANGQLSEKEIDQMVPNTYRGNIGKFLEKITNKPEGTEAQAFVDRAVDFFKRESDLTSTQMTRRVNELSTPYKHILDRNGDVATEIFSTYGVNHPKYNPGAAPSQASQPASNDKDPLGLFK